MCLPEDSGDVGSGDARGEGGRVAATHKIRSAMSSPCFRIASGRMKVCLAGVQRKSQKHTAFRPSADYLLRLLARHSLPSIWHIWAFRTQNSPGVVNVDAMPTLLIFSSSWIDEFDEVDVTAGRWGLGEMISDIVAVVVSSCSVVDTVAGSDLCGDGRRRGFM